MHGVHDRCRTSDRGGPEADRDRRGEAEAPRARRAHDPVPFWFGGPPCWLPLAWFSVESKMEVAVADEPETVPTTVTVSPALTLLIVSTPLSTLVEDEMTNVVVWPSALFAV